MRSRGVPGRPRRALSVPGTPTRPPQAHARVPKGRLTVSKALTKAESETRLATLVNDITSKAMERVAAKLDDEGGLWNDRSVADQYALEVYKQTMANRRGDVAAAATLGVV